ncbi:MAG TPA: CoA transferase, partial [Stellaceae bacterium]
VFADPQVKHLGIAQSVEHPALGRIELVGQAVSLSRTPSRLTTASPDPGEHTDAILGELGYSDSEIAGLRERRIV